MLSLLPVFRLKKQTLTTRWAMRHHMAKRCKGWHWHENKNDLNKEALQSTTHQLSWRMACEQEALKLHDRSVHSNLIGASGLTR